MIHGTTDRLLTWCMDEVIAVDGWSIEVDSVECIECLRRQGEALREENARLIELNRYNVAQAKQDIAALEAKLAKVVEALEAMVIVMESGQPCYRTGNGIPQEMPRKVERVVRAALRGGEK